MDNQSAPIGFAVIGYGRIGKRHAALIEAHPETRLVAMADVNGAGKEGVPLFGSLEELLSAPLSTEIDVVTITTPNGHHAAQACLALKAGKHVVVEKPFALSVAESEKVIDTASAMGKKIFVVVQNRHSAPSVWIKELIAGGTLGKIFMVQVNAYWNRGQTYYPATGWHGKKALDGGTLFTQFSHFIDMLYWLFGDISAIRSRFANFSHQGLTEFEDSGMVQFDLAGGGMGCLNFSTAAWDQNLESSLTILGEFGTVRLGGQYMERVEYCHIKAYSPPPDEFFASPLRNDPDNHRKVLAGVVDVLRGRTMNDTDAGEGLKVVDIIERIYRS